LLIYKLSQVEIYGRFWEIRGFSPKLFYLKFREFPLKIQKKFSKNFYKIPSLSTREIINIIKSTKIRKIGHTKRRNHMAFSFYSPLDFSNKLFFISEWNWFHYWWEIRMNLRTFFWRSWVRGFLKVVALGFWICV
jgi:hypothetical protein